MIPAGYGEIINFDAFSTTHGNQTEVRRVRVRIFKKDYSGAVTEFEGAGKDCFDIEYGRQEEYLYQPIVTSRATLNLHVTNATQANLIEDIFASDYDEYLMDYSFSIDGVNFTPYWSGFVNTAFYEEQFRPFPYASTIKASCGLNLLKDISFTPDGVKDIFALIRGILVPVQRDIPYSISDRIFSSIFDSSNTLNDPNRQSFIDSTAYARDGDDKSAFDVLERLLQAKQLTISHALGRWQIWNRDNLGLGANFVRRFYDINGSYTGELTGNRDRNISCGSGQQLKWLSTPTKILTAPVDEVRIRYDFDQLSSLEENNWIRGADWSGPAENPNLELSGWAFTSQGYNNGSIVQDPDTVNMVSGGNNGTSALRMTMPILGIPLVDPIPNPDTLSFIERTNYPALSVDDNLRLRFQLQIRANLTVDAVEDPAGAQGTGTGTGTAEITADSVPMFLNIKYGNFQLNQDHDWVENPASDIYILITDSSGNLIGAETSFADYQFDTATVPSSESLSYRITTGIDTAGDETIRAVDSVDINSIKILFIDADGVERSLDSLEFVARKDVPQVRRRLTLGPFKHGDGPIGGYKGAIRDSEDDYTRFWGFAGGDQILPLYEFMAREALLQKGQPRETVRGTLLGRADYSNALQDVSIRYFAQYMRLRPVVNEVDVYAERVTRFTFPIGDDLIEMPGPIRSALISQQPNSFQAQQKAIKAFTQDGTIRKSVQVEVGGVDGTLSSKTSKLDATGRIVGGTNVVINEFENATLGDFVEYDAGTPFLISGVKVEPGGVDGTLSAKTKNLNDTGKFVGGSEIIVDDAFPAVNLGNYLQVGAGDTPVITSGVKVEVGGVDGSLSKRIQSFDDDGKLKMLEFSVPDYTVVSSNVSLVPSGPIVGLVGANDVKIILSAGVDGQRVTFFNLANRSVDIVGVSEVNLSFRESASFVYLVSKLGVSQGWYIESTTGASDIDTDGAVDGDLLIRENGIFKPAGAIEIRSALGLEEGFVMTINSANAGVTTDTEFQLTGAVGDYDVEVYQNNQRISKVFNLSGQQTITLPSAGVYDILVIPKGATPFNRIQFNNGGDKDKVIALRSFGVVEWSSFFRAFLGSNIATLPTSVNRLNGVNVTDFSRCFFGNNLTTIPAGLFDNNPNVTTFQLCFFGNNLTSIPAGLFDNCPNVTTFRDCFRGNSLTTLPAGLFDNCPNVTSFTLCFLDNNLTSIPAGLFDNNPNVTTFIQCFRNNSLTTLPAGLFDNCPNVTTFSFCFLGNTLEVESLSRLYIELESTNVEDNVPFHGGSGKFDPNFTLGGLTTEQARDNLIARGWTLSDGGSI